jgi:molybdopterin-guanine dinucleotide biosynthesis protein A
MTDKDGRYEPLFACYKKSVLPYAEMLLSKGNNSMLGLFDGLKVRKIKSTELGVLWNEKLLMNINRPSDYEKLCLELTNQ